MCCMYSMFVAIVSMNQASMPNFQISFTFD